MRCIEFKYEKVPSTILVLNRWSIDVNIFSLGPQVEVSPCNIPTRYYYHPYFISEETEARGINPRSHS